LKSDTLLYDKVAKNITELINEGVLRPGSKIPSVRKLKSKMKVSASTVVQAYSLLEAKGLIEARPKSGYYVRFQANAPVPKTPVPATISIPLKISDFVASVLQSNQQPEVYPFGIAVPDARLLPAKTLNRELSAAARLAGESGLQYDYPPGCQALRKQLSLRSLSWGNKLSPDEFITTSGTIDALGLALRAVTKPGDIVAVEAPTFFGILRLTEELGLKVLEIPVDPLSGPRLDILKTALSKNRISAFITIPNFQNPVGSTMSDANKMRLIEISESYNLPIIEDDIYGDLHFGMFRPRTLKSFDKKGLVLLCSSISKSLAPGYRVGWIAPGKFKSRVALLKSIVSGETSTLTQIAIANFMKNGSYDRHLKWIRKSFEHNVQVTRDTVIRYFPEGTKVSQPAGGFVLWIELQQKMDSLKLQQKALEKKISIAPGPIFSARKQFKNYLRLSCGHRISTHTEAAIKKLATLIVN